ncbi:MAG TPA: helix-turn-helix transcriptional regulator [Rhizomicrobium sp.]|jgi:transcriptional regulator with XRE-family HTH domain
MTNRLDMTDNPLGSYLKDRRARLDPAAFGFPLTRRRTPGLRREEVAQRAHVSATWYTWLEQGRGGAPSPDVLVRIARAMMLTEVEREHLFLLALGRPPDVRYHATETVSPQLQRVLDAMEYSPAYVKTPAWDLVAWNFAATVVLADYSTIPASHRNLLRLIFHDSHIRAAQQQHWETTARFAVAAFRADVARAGLVQQVQALVDELRRISPEFDTIWRDNDVRSTYSEFAKSLRHPKAGVLRLDYSAFSVSGRPDLDMIVYNPATAEDVARVKALIASQRLAEAAE